jgi:PilZ domain
MGPSQPPSFDSPHRPGRPKREGRAWPRFPSQVKAFCQSVKAEDEVPWLIRVQDLSCQGLKIVSRHRFEPGTILRIGSTHEKTGVLLARALYIVPSAEGQWEIGCSFAKKLDEAELQAWLQENR